MIIPNYIIMPLFIAAFVICYLQFYLHTPKRLLLNPFVGLMAGAFVLMIANLATGGDYSWTFLALGLAWLGAAIALRRLQGRAAATK
jgi:Flp pilus assembly protein protease CpaA